MSNQEVLYTPRRGVTAPPLDHVPEGERARLQALMEVWDRLLGPGASTGPDGDREDFFEAALTAEAVVDCYGLENVWLRDPGTNKATNPVSGEVRSVEECEHMPVFGPLASIDRTPPRSEDLADDYMDLNAFRENAGRGLVRATAFGDGEDGYPSIEQAVVGFHDAGVRKVVVKNRKTKSGLWVVELPEDRGAAFERVNAAMEWTSVVFEGAPGQFLVQEHVPMSYEYRVFVVDHEVVTGAGCIEEFMPLDRVSSGVFDPQVRERRQSTGTVEVREGVAAALGDFARGLTEQVRREVPLMTHYVVDVAMGEAGQPLVVEFNGLRNSGYYANDPAVIMKAFKQAEPVRVDQLIPDPFADIMRNARPAQHG